MAAVYAAREGPPEIPLRQQHAKVLREFLALCERHADAEHKKTRELARELLNDWDTFWVVLDYPWLPLTNNEAERALRHWVIARRISYGTRTAARLSRLRADDQRHRDLPQARRLALAVSRRCHQAAAQRPARSGSAAACGVKFRSGSVSDFPCLNPGGSNRLRAGSRSAGVCATPQAE